ncbi:hypothetical protein ACTD5D_40050 [Nocardia takedensis]|uniref:hypothetical protein n=1 Tax=Nocardia takedensis TaxID=259390 RepID=UPI003F757E2C
MMRAARPVVSVAALTSAVVWVCACGGVESVSPPPLPTPSSRAGAAIPITSAGPGDGSDVEAVAAGAMREMFTLRPSSEDPNQSLRRARPWLSPAFVARVEQTSAPGPDLRWASWASAKARVDAAVFVSAEPPPQSEPGRTGRKVAVRQTVRGAVGSTEILAPFTALVTLVSTSEGWRVDDVRTW